MCRTHEVLHAVSLPCCAAAPALSSPPLPWLGLCRCGAWFGRFNTEPSVLRGGRERAHDAAQHGPRDGEHPGARVCALRHERWI